jgi:hypothetical protein
MRYQPLPLLLGSFALFFIVGCSPDSQSYSVSVHNQTDTPVTLILTKDRPQSEEMWASPEDLIAGRAVEVPGDRTGWVELPANKTANLTTRGDFPPGVHAMLRVYRGNRLKLKEMEIMNPGPDRADIMLSPEGDNNLIIRDKGGKQLSIVVVPPPK